MLWTCIMNSGSDSVTGMGEIFIQCMGLVFMQYCVAFWKLHTVVVIAVYKVNNGLATIMLNTLLLYFEVNMRPAECCPWWGGIVLQNCYVNVFFYFFYISASNVHKIFSLKTDCLFSILCFVFRLFCCSIAKCSVWNCIIKTVNMTFNFTFLFFFQRRKLDAVYYYMRSLMASNPFQSARESLILLFDESRKKVGHVLKSYLTFYS